MQVLDWGHDPYPFMVMEKVDGNTLQTAMRHGPVKVEQATVWLEEILQALAVAHGTGIVHRDLKPSNLMVTGHAGMSKSWTSASPTGMGHDTLTRSGDSMGTPLYMSPEHLDAKTVTPASDLYSVGVLTYECLPAPPRTKPTTPIRTG